MTVERLCLVETSDAAVEPSLCKPKASLGILPVALTRGTFVERHHDVGSYYALCVHHVLRCEYVSGTIDVGAELASFLAQFSDARE